LRARPDSPLELEVSDCVASDDSDNPERIANPTGGAGDDFICVDVEDEPSVSEIDVAVGEDAIEEGGDPDAGPDPDPDPDPDFARSTKDRRGGNPFPEGPCAPEVGLFVAS